MGDRPRRVCVWPRAVAVRSPWEREDKMENWYIYIPFGIACGVFGATLGVGSGVLMVPMLVLFMHFPQKAAQGISLAVIAPMAMVGALRYKMNMREGMDMTVALLLAIGAVVGALLGSALAMWLSGATLRRIFAVVMILIAAKIFFVEDPRPGAGGGNATDYPPGTGAVPASPRDGDIPSRRQTAVDEGEQAR